MSLMIEVAGKSDVGCVRKNNEDNFGYDLRYGIFVVCDGMGGQAAGEVASKMAVDTILELFRQSPSPDQPLPEGVSEDILSMATALRNAAREANRLIYQAGKSNQTKAGM